MQTVVETSVYLRQAERIFTSDERDAIIALLAENPNAGVPVAGDGGVRKLRVGVEGRGKRCGAQVIYFYADSSLPVFLLAAFAKNEKADASAAEQKSMKKDVDEILRRRRH